MKTFTDPREILDWFWEIVSRAGKSRQKLKEILLEFDYDQLSQFEREYKDAAKFLTYDHFIEHMQGKSEDDIEDLTGWIVGQGKDYFMNIWNHPENTPPIEGSFDTNLAGVAWQVCEEKFGSVPNKFGS